MKVKNLVLIAVVFVFIGFLSSCEKNDTAETDSLYEIHNVDREKIRIVGDHNK